jgi:hypothetical protein
VLLFFVTEAHVLCIHKKWKRWILQFCVRAHMLMRLCVYIFLFFFAVKTGSFVYDVNIGLDNWQPSKVGIFVYMYMYAYKVSDTLHHIVIFSGSKMWGILLLITVKLLHVSYEFCLIDFLWRWLYLMNPKVTEIFLEKISACLEQNMPFVLCIRITWYVTRNVCR